MKLTMKTIGCISLALFSFPALAASMINVTVTTNTPMAAGIGYTVDGKESGGPGKSYTGTGPKNKTYAFGYRKKAKGANISCGSVKLRKNANVTLVVKGNSCHTVVN